MREHWIYKICKIRMSKQAMADIAYAMIMTKSQLHSSHGIGIYRYTRKQNAYNRVDFLVFIHPDKITQFEEIAKVELRDTPYIHVNSSSDSYGDGRLKVINEMFEYCNGLIDDAAIAKGIANKNKHTYKRSHLSGVITTLIKIQDKLSNKFMNTISHPNFKHKDKSTTSGKTE